MIRSLASWFACSFIVLVLQASRPAEAGLIITIADTELSALGIGSVDVLIRSDASDTLSNFGFTFRIQQLGVTTTQLRFAASQSDSQLTSSDYVFNAGSLKRDGDPLLSINPEPVGSVQTDQFPDDTFVGLDSYTLLAPPSVTLTSNDQLLARLDLVPGPGFLAPAAGDEFEVSLVAGPFTTFLDENLVELAYDVSMGTITIASVPEPGTMFSTFVGLLAGYRHLRRRRPAADIV